jgi:8-amino-7-oxononanoate synthase
MSAGFQFAERLENLERLSQRRVRRRIESACAPVMQVDGRELLIFCSNDYLGLASDPAIIEAMCEGARRFGAGAGASQLISGYFAPHDVLEQRLAAFTGMPRALTFSSGYLANMGVITALVRGGDAVFSDQLNHASLIDGVRLSGAERHIYPHADMAALKTQLEACGSSRKLVVSDGVFSMDGDLAPLPELLALCERYDALLYIDDAHGFGVLGPQGRGSVAQFALASPRIVYMGTLGKAAGVAGAFVAGSEELIEWLVQSARTFIFETGSPPAIAHALCTALDLIEQGDERRSHLQSLIRGLREGLQGLRWTLAQAATPIQPLLIGGNDEALALGAALLEQGIWTPVIRPPTVAPGTARLRISLSAAHSSAQVARLVDALRHCG